MLKHLALTATGSVSKLQPWWNFIWCQPRGTKRTIAVHSNKTKLADWHMPFLKCVFVYRVRWAWFLLDFAISCFNRDSSLHHVYTIQRCWSVLNLEWNLATFMQYSYVYDWYCMHFTTWPVLLQSHTLFCIGVPIADSTARPWSQVR